MITKKHGFKFRKRDVAECTLYFLEIREKGALLTDEPIKRVLSDNKFELFEIMNCSNSYSYCLVKLQYLKL